MSNSMSEECDVRRDERAEEERKMAWERRN